MNWKSIKEGPHEGWGWFVVATVPKNHSGSREEPVTQADLALDNDWRRSFGFEKAWLNNGRFYTGSMHDNKSVDITEYVTHWDYPPEVPELTEPHQYTSNRCSIYDRDSEEDVRKIALTQIINKRGFIGLINNKDYVEPKSFVSGFVAAFKFLGILN
jgi:hypothetical protein